MFSTGWLFFGNVSDGRWFFNFPGCFRVTSPTKGGKTAAGNSHDLVDFQIIIILRGHFSLIRLVPVSILGNYTHDSVSFFSLWPQNVIKKSVHSRTKGNRFSAVLFFLLFRTCSFSTFVLFILGGRLLCASVALEKQKAKNSTTNGEIDDGAGKSQTHKRRCKENSALLYGPFLQCWFGAHWWTK